MSLLILGGATAGDRLAATLAAQGVEAVRSSDDCHPPLVPAPTAIIILVGADRVAGPLSAMSEADWTTAFDQPLRQTRERLQRAEMLLAEGGRVILVATTGGMAGVAGDVAGCAVEEAARALAKSVALAWQPRGITLAFAAFAADALDTRSGVEAIVAPTVRLLLDAVPAFGGSTVIADGGVLLAP